MKTNFYIDGFNLYYGAVKDTPYKWLDIGAFCRLGFKKHSIHRIRYFTANVGRLKGHEDPKKAQRQQAYIRALETIPELSVHYGHFLQNTVRMPLAYPPEEGPKTVVVIKTEEKGSDVNLASYLLLDAFDSDFDVAVVVSNDSDLAEPIRIVHERFDRPVIVFCPHQQTSRSLQAVASYCKPIRKGLLAACQFPDMIEDDLGTIRKPEEWFAEQPRKRSE